MVKKNKSKISVVIPTYNSWTTLKDCIASIQKQTLRPFEVIVVDNASSDGTSDKVRKTFPEVKLFTLRKNTGVTGGRNKGIENCSSKIDFILFFDHDMIADKRMLKELVRTANLVEQIGIVTPKIYYFDDKKRIWAAGTGINLWTGQILFRGGKDIGQFEVAEEVQVAPAVLLVKRKVISKLKAFDERYFATYEDTDFCFRAKSAGFKVFYTPKSYAFHKIPSNLDEESKRLLSRAYWVGRNRILFMKDFGNNFYIFLLFIPIYIIYYLRLALVNSNLKSWFKLIEGTFAGIIRSTLPRKIIFSGERPSLSDIDGQHLSKYKFALIFCKNKKILEIGCGSGYGSKYLAENGVKKITAYDIDVAAIKYAKENYFHDNIFFAEGDAQVLELKDKYDVVLSFEVIEHLSQPKKLIELAKSNLKKDGLLILSTPNRAYSTYDGGKPSNPYHTHEFYPQELKRFLAPYFKTTELYGVILYNKKKVKEEREMHKSWRWRIANYLTDRRIVRRIMNYLPEYPKRLITGEGKLSFSTNDFRVYKDREEEATDFIAVCR